MRCFVINVRRKINEKGTYCRSRVFGFYVFVGFRLGTARVLLGGGLFIKLSFFCVYVVVMGNAINKVLFTMMIEIM